MAALAERQILAAALIWPASMWCCACAGPARAATQSPTPPPPQTTVSQDQAARLTIAVRVNGQGPFPFVLDTGADRTVISRELAAKLKLPPGHPVTLHDAAGVSPAETVIIDRLAFGGREVRTVQAPLLAAGNLGALGMLGLDSLRNQQVRLDFHAKTFTATESRWEAAFPSSNTMIVRGRLRFGQLILIGAEAEGVPITVILDSGAQGTLGNADLQRLMHNAQGKKDRQVGDVISVTGKHIQADLDVISDIRLGGIEVRHVPVAYADLETFREFQLTGQPALLLGMDVLRLFRSVSIDFHLRRAVFVAD